MKNFLILIAVLVPEFLLAQSQFECGFDSIIPKSTVYQNTILQNRNNLDNGDTVTSNGAQ